jgi:hypothetical protein
MKEGQKPNVKLEGINVCGCSVEVDPKGNFIYKSDNNPFNLNGLLKTKYAELPRYKAIIEAEKEFLSDYNRMLKQSVIECAQVLSSFGH